MENLWKYSNGVYARLYGTIGKSVSCSSSALPVRFHFVGVRIDLEHDIPDLLSTEASIFYSQGSLSIPCVI